MILTTTDSVEGKRITAYLGVVSGASSAFIVARKVSPSMSSSATRQPSARKRFAVASPIPRAAPVTSATF